MQIQQISVFVENKSGRLAEITEALAAANVDIRAVSIADTSDFGILRLIVNKPKEAVEALKAAGSHARAGGQSDWRGIYLCVCQPRTWKSLCDSSCGRQRAGSKHAQGEWNYHLERGRNLRFVIYLDFYTNWSGQEDFLSALLFSRERKFRGFIEKERGKLCTVPRGKDYGKRKRKGKFFPSVL